MKVVTRTLFIAGTALSTATVTFPVQGEDVIQPAPQNIVSPSASPTGSLQFPPLNRKYDNHGGSIAYPTDNLTASGDEVFAYNKVCAFWIQLEFPWERLDFNNGYQAFGTSSNSTGSQSTSGTAFQAAFWGGAWNQTFRRNNFFLRANRSGTDLVDLEVDLNALQAANARNILLVFSSDGSGTFRSRAFATGQPVTTGTSVNGNLHRLTTTFTTHIRLGDVGIDATDDSQSAAGNIKAAWPGSVFSHGFVEGTEGSDSEWQAIIDGAGIEASLGGATAFTLARDFRGASSISDALAASFTGDATLAGVELGTITKGSTARQSASKFLTFDALPGGYVADIKKDQTTGSVALTGGQSAGLSGRLFARAVDPATDSVLSPPVEVGSIAAIANASFNPSGFPAWGVVEVWAESDPETVCRLAEWFGCGDKVGAIGQSQVEYALNRSGLPIATTEPMSFVLRGPNRPQIVPIIAAMTTEYNGAKGIAQRLAQVNGGRAVCVVDVSQAGTSADQWTDDGVGRPWQDDVDMAALAGTDKQPVWNWFTSDVGLDYNDVFDDVVLGTGPLAGDHTLFDGSVFDQTGYLLAVSDPSRSTNGNAGAGPSDFDTATVQRSEAVAEQRNWVANNPSLALFGPNVPDMAIDDDAAAQSPPGDTQLAGPHPSIWVSEGGWRLGYRMGEAAARAKGYSTLQDPALDAAGASINGGRTVITIPMVLPNAGSSPVTQDSAAIGGFEFSEDGGSTWSRSGYSAQVVSSSVEITKSSGSWAANLQWRYAPYGPYSFGTLVELDAPYKGHLYDGVSGFEGGLGLPFDSVSTAQVLA
ncbi:MAG: hypothetical protein AAFY42_02910 [Pseudomonadota bacterium]